MTRITCLLEDQVCLVKTATTKEQQQEQQQKATTVLAVIMIIKHEWPHDK